MTGVCFSNGVYGERAYGIGHVPRRNSCYIMFSLHDRLPSLADLADSESKLSALG